MEVCTIAAIRMDDGTIKTGRRHADIMQVIWQEKPDYHINRESQGFMTSEGNFVGREQGAHLQKVAEIPSIQNGGRIGRQLTSEDLY